MNIYDNNSNKYTPVEYLQSTGTQYIDTYINTSSDIKVYIDFIPTEYNDNAIIGGRTNNYDNEIFINVYDNDGTNKSFVRFGDNTNYIIGNLLFERTNIILSNQGVFINNIKVIDDFNNNFSDNGYGMSVFGFRNITTGNMLVYGRLKLYKLKVYNGQDLIRDYIPVLDSSSRPCLFDKVGKTCFYNQGTGEFLYG